METPEHLKHIAGWGIDADPQNEPTYPIKNYTGDDHARLNWERPELQPEHVEILKSVERPYNTAVFGTGQPPSGLSGKIRRFAFQFSESSYGHWLPLLFADRVNMIEGVIDDLKKGHLPNVFKERGWDAEWKYNRSGVIKNIAIGTIAAVVTYNLLKKKRK
jgi:hypothetical protein